MMLIIMWNCECTYYSHESLNEEFGRASWLSAENSLSIWTNNLLFHCSDVLLFDNTDQLPIFCCISFDLFNKII